MDQCSGRSEEVGSFQAHDTIITKEKAYENAQYMLEEGYAEDRLKNDFLMASDVKNRISTSGILIRRSMKLTEKIPVETRSRITGGYQVKSIFIMACNGEYDNYNGKAGERAVPYYLSVNIEGPDHKKIGANVFFTKMKSIILTMF
jgi:hypothetical protein